MGGLRRRGSRCNNCRGGQKSNNTVITQDETLKPSEPIQPDKPKVDQVPPPAPEKVSVKEIAAI